jgi:hypothetical protein
MGIQIDILTGEEELSELRAAIRAFVKTYGDCSARIYPPDSLIEEDGMVIHGQYGTLDALLAPLMEEKLLTAVNLDEARSMMKWDLVIFASDDDDN